MDASGRIIGRSGLERKVSQQLIDTGVEFEYEKEKYKWWEEIRNAECEECGSRDVYKERSYTPDYFLSNGIVIEVKGRLTARDRKILLGVRKDNPDLDLRLVFDKDNRISKQSNTRYSEWARKHKFKYGLDGVVPESWLRKRPTPTPNK